MSPKVLLSIAFLMGAAAQAADAAPCDGAHTQPTASTHTSTQSDWFERQRQRTDGNVDPR